MYSKNIRKSKLKSFKHKQLLLSAAITMGIVYPPNVISQPLTKPRLNEVNIYSNKSFITKAVERTGSSVVTIDTERYIKRRKLLRNSQLFLDPYFERFFTRFSYDNQLKTEQNQVVYFCRRTCND